MNFCCASVENIDRLIEAQKKDKYCRDIFAKLQNTTSHIKSSIFSIAEGILHFQKNVKFKFKIWNFKSFLY